MMRSKLLWGALFAVSAISTTSFAQKPRLAVGNIDGTGSASMIETIESLIGKKSTVDVVPDADWEAAATRIDVRRTFASGYG